MNTPGAFMALTQFWDATPSPVGPVSCPLPVRCPFGSALTACVRQVDSWTLHGKEPYIGLMGDRRLIPKQVFGRTTAANLRATGLTTATVRLRDRSFATDELTRSQ